MRLRNATRHPILRRFVVAFLVLVASVLSLSRVAYADSTPNACDPDMKYWCYSVTYTTYVGGVGVSIRTYWGSLGGGGALWWERYITQDWHYDSGSGSWTFIQGWAPGSQHYGTATESVSASNNINNEAVVRMQDQFESSTGSIYCDGYIDWHITDTSNYSSQGPYGCLTPVY